MLDSSSEFSEGLAVRPRTTGKNWSKITFIWLLISCLDFLTSAGLDRNGVLFKLQLCR